MTRQFKTVDYEAALEQTVSLREALPAHHLARFVVDVVAELDLSCIYYRLRKCTVEPVIGIIKAVLGFRQFSLRGLDAADGEWCLVCLAFNLKRLQTLSWA